MKHSVKRNNKEIFAYLRDKQTECCIQHHSTLSNNQEQRLRQRRFASL